MASTYELVIQATDKTRGPLRNIERSLKSIDKQTDGLNRGFKLLGGAIAAIGAGSVLKSIVRTTSRFEDLQDTLNAVTGSANTGAAAFRGIQKFATQTQFGVEDLTNTYIKLAGAGIKPTTQLLTTFTDAAAITTDQVGTLQAITDLFARTTAGGLGLEDLNRLADRGVPVFDILQEKLNLARLEVSEFGKSAEGARKITEALAQGINERFGGATEQKVDNLSTSMSNFGIAVTNAAARFGKQFRPQLAAAINDATKFLNQNDKLIDALGSGLGEAIVVSSKALGVLAQNIDLVRNAILTGVAIAGARSFVTLIAKINSATVGAKTFTGFIGGAGKAIVRLAGSPLKALGGIAKVLGVGGPIGLGILAIVSALTFFQDSMVNVGGTAASMGEVVKATFDLLGQAAQAAFGYFQNVASKAWEGVLDLFSGFGDTYYPAFEDFGKAARSIFNNFINTVVYSMSAAGDVIMNLPRFFFQAFGAVMKMLDDFARSVGAKFSQIGEAIQLGLAFEFGAAMEKLGEDTGYKFSESFANAIQKIDPVIDTDASAIFGVDRFGQLSESIQRQVNSSVKAVKDDLLPVYESVTAAIAGQVEANRAQQKSIEQVVDKQKTANDEFEAAGENIIPSVITPTVELTDANLDLEKSVARVESQYSRFLKPLQEAALKTDVMANNYRRLLADFGDSKKGTRGFEILQEGIRELADDGFLPAIERVKEYENSLEGIVVMSKTKFKDASDTLAQDLARGLAQGKTSLNDFKSFFGQVLEDITQEIIRRRITQPLVDEIVGFVDGIGGKGGGFNLGSIGSFFSSGGGGFDLGGTLSSIGSFFGLANGGIAQGGSPVLVGERGPELFVPNTTGSVVPREEMGMGNTAHVTFNINAIDTSNAAQVIAQNRDMITAMVSDSFNKQGRRGILG